MSFLNELWTMIRWGICDWPLGTIVMIILLVSVLISIWLILEGLFLVLDSWFLKPSRKVGRVVKKRFTPSHTKMILIPNAATKTSMPHFVTEPANWSVWVRLDGKQDSVSVSKKFFNTLSENSLVMTKYVIGRFSGNLYIRTVSRV